MPAKLDQSRIAAASKVRKISFQLRIHVICVYSAKIGLPCPSGIPEWSDHFDSPGLQGGTRETSNWIAAAAMAGKPATVVDYVAVYSSPIGCGFAYWDGFYDASPVESPRS